MDFDETKSSEKAIGCLGARLASLEKRRGGCRPFAILPLAVVCLTLGGCGTPGDDAAAGAAAWVGTITTERDVTTVRNESGSVWGGRAALVEEASIGVETGEDAYMLGNVRGVTASDERIYVIDRQVPALRVYDWNGVYLRDFGGEGDGPGEFRYPMGVGVDEAGRVWVHDPISRRIVVFSPSGDAVATLTLGGSRMSGEFPSLVVADDGRAYVFDVVRPEDPTAAGASFRQVMRPYDLEGVSGEPVDIPRADNPAYLEARAEGVIRVAGIPFLPGLVTAFAPSRAVLSGSNDAYRFEVRHADGSITVVERFWEPVPVHADEAAAHERAATAYLRDMDPAWTWRGPPIPAIKPAFSRLVPAVSGEVWLVRRGPATLDSDCDEASFDLDGEAHCWPEQRVVDAFDADGRYLGEVDVPAALSFEPRPFIRGNDVIARLEDEAGTIMVKRYRLVPPS